MSQQNPHYPNQPHQQPGGHPQQPHPGQPQPGQQAPGSYAQGPYAPEQPAPKPKKPWYKRVWVWLLAAILIIVFAVNTGGDDSSSGDSGTSNTTASDTAGEAQDDEAQGPPMEVTTDQLLEDLEGNALKAEQTYNGQYVKVTGTVSNIDAQGGYFSVDRGPDAFDLINVQAFYEEDLKSQVAEFTTGEEVTFTGTVTDVGEIMGYSIDVESID